MIQVNLSYTIQGETEPSDLSFYTKSSVDPWENKQYLFGRGGDPTKPITFTTSDPAIAEVKLNDSVWELDYKGIGAVDIIAVQESKTLSKTVTINNPAKGRIVNVGTGSGSLVISQSGDNLLPGDTIVIAAGSYSSITIRDILIPDGEAKLEIIGSGLIVLEGNGRSFVTTNLRNVIIDGSRADGYKYGIIHRNNSDQKTMPMNNLNHVEFRNFDLYNLGWQWEYETVIKYDGTESSYSQDVVFRNIRIDRTQGISTKGDINMENGDGITGLIVGWKFIGCELSNMSPGYNIYIGAGQDILFDKLIINNVNPKDNRHNGIFFVNGHANISNCKVTNHQGNLIRLWPFSIVDGHFSNGSSLLTSHFYNNSIFRSRVYSAFEIQGMDRYYQSGVTAGVNLVVYNNTTGYFELNPPPPYFQGLLIDAYSPGLGGSILVYNNILAKSTKPGEFFLFMPTTSQHLIENRLYDDLNDAKFNPANFTLLNGSTAKGVGVVNSYTSLITHDMYGQPITEPLSMGAVQVRPITLPTNIAPPSNPDISTFTAFGPPEEWTKTKMCLALSASKSEIGIDNYDVEVNGVVETTTAGYPRIGRRANYPTEWGVTNDPFLADNTDYVIRFRARDFRGQLSGWSGYKTVRTVSEA